MSMVFESPEEFQTLLKKAGIQLSSSKRTFKASSKGAEIEKVSEKYQKRVIEKFMDCMRKDKFVDAFRWVLLAIHYPEEKKAQDEEDSEGEDREREERAKNTLYVRAGESEYLDRLRKFSFRSRKEPVIWVNLPHVKYLPEFCQMVSQIVRAEVSIGSLRPISVGGSYVLELVSENPESSSEGSEDTKSASEEKSESSEEEKPKKSKTSKKKEEKTKETSTSEGKKKAKKEGKKKSR
jgi:hypothetical protein